MSDQPLINNLLLAQLLQRLTEANISFCHWKSNWKVKEALANGEEVDLLLSTSCAEKFNQILSELNFRLAILPQWASTPNVSHYYGFNSEKGDLLHVHVYYDLITGGALLKNFALPLEELIFQNLNFELPLPIVNRDVELGTFLLRKILEHGSLPELLLVLREWKDIRDEFCWLYDESATKPESLHRIFQPHLPELMVSDWQMMIATLKLDSTSQILQRIVFAKKLRRKLKKYARLSALPATTAVWHRFACTLRQRFIRKRRAHQLATGGRIIAVVGPEATGKSTLLGELRTLLGEHFEVFQLHAGQPPSTFISVLPNSLMPLLRRVLKAFRSGEIESDLQTNTATSTTPAAGLKMYAFAIRSLMIAFDRRAALRKAYARSRRGAIILSDRYPSPKAGAMDSGQLLLEYPQISGSKLLRAAAALENRLYQQIPPPDLVIQLSVPVETALERNRLRKKRGKEGDDYVIRRHKQSLLQEYPRSKVFKIDTSTSLEKSILEVKSAVWNNF